MRCIIAGSRNITSLSMVIEAVDKSKFNIVKVISGGARGVDKLGELYAKTNNIDIELFPANWDKYGKSAGYIRNEEMAKNADALIAIWDGISKGTKHMIGLANKYNLDVYTYKVSNG